MIEDGRLYGRGAVDMKGGIAASIMAFKLLAEVRDGWTGEVVLTLAADEESMGTWGSDYLLRTKPESRGDALICGDAGCQVSSASARKACCGSSSWRAAEQAMVRTFT